MNMETIEHKIETDWGVEFVIMEVNGHSISRVYMFNDNPLHIVLDMLSVSKEYRKLGYGLKMQQYREEMGRGFGCTHSTLWVEKESWMEKWYVRRGYVEYADKDDNHIWMKKEL